MHAAQVMIIEQGDMRGVSDVIGSCMSSAILVRSECYIVPMIKNLVIGNKNVHLMGQVVVRVCMFL